MFDRNVEQSRALVVAVVVVVVLTIMIDDYINEPIGMNKELESEVIATDRADLDQERV